MYNSSLLFFEDELRFSTEQMTIRTLLPVFILVLSSPSLAENYSWIIGGGPTKERSEIQIERNVKWAGDVIKNKSDNSVLKIFYTDGDDPKPDVVDFIDREDKDNKYILDMVFGGAGFHPSVYSNHTIQSHAGSTHPDNLIPSLEKDFSTLKGDDTALILYNGHGWGNASDHGLSTLRLWTEKGYTAYDFENLLSNIDEQVPVRFVLTQCFSGGFARIIHPDARADTMELEGNRCGFMAESATREAEGCSASLTVGEYRDYTTFMFAALDGKTRLGDPLDYDPDINGDKKVSFREAHLYTLASAYSTDLSRSTTEYYLEKWEPWYIRWIPKDARSKNSMFHRIMNKVAINNEITTELAESPPDLRAERIKRMHAFESIQREMSILKKKIRVLQKSIIIDLKQLSPDIERTYKAGFGSDSALSLKVVISQIANSKKINELKQLFNEKDSLDRVLLDAERSLAQVEKIARLSKLAKLDAMFSVFATKGIRANYRQLLSCEEGFL